MVGLTSSLNSLKCFVYNLRMDSRIYEILFLSMWHSLYIHPNLIKVSLGIQWMMYTRELIEFVINFDFNCLLRLSVLIMHHFLLWDQMLHNWKFKKKKQERFLIRLVETLTKYFIANLSITYFIFEWIYGLLKHSIKTNSSEFFCYYLHTFNCSLTF